MKKVFKRGGKTGVMQSFFCGGLLSFLLLWSQNMSQTTSLTINSSPKKERREGEEEEDRKRKRRAVITVVVFLVFVFLVLVLVLVLVLGNNVVVCCLEGWRRGK